MSALLMPDQVPLRQNRPAALVSIEPMSRFEAAIEALTPFQDEIGDVLDMMRCNLEDMGPDGVLEEGLFQLLPHNHTAGLVELIPFVTPKDREEPFCSAARKDRGECIKAMMPFVSDHCVSTALRRHLDTPDPRDREIFDLLWPRLSEQPQLRDIALYIAVLNGHVDLAHDMLPQCKPWAVCKMLKSANDIKAMKLRIDRLWAQSIMDGEGPLPHNGNADSVEWASQLPMVTAALEKLQLDGDVTTGGNTQGPRHGTRL